MAKRTGAPRAVAIGLLVAVAMVMALLAALLLAQRPAAAPSAQAMPSQAQPPQAVPGQAQFSPPTATAPPPATTRPTQPSAAATAALALGIYITGAVAQPNQVLYLPPGSRVIDAVNAAGGALPEADLERINLAARLNDADHIHVATIGTPAPPGQAGIQPTARSASPASTAAVRFPIAINRATAAELDALPGIGPVTAAAIIAYRDARGGFRISSQLLEVNGIGDATLERLLPLISFE